MLTTDYRQSLISDISPRHIQVNEGFLILYKSINATIAHGVANYLFDLEDGKYPLNTGLSEYYIYLKIDKTSGEQSIEISEYDTTEVGYGFPQSFPRNKLYFNLETEKSYIRDINAWVEILRVNLCKVREGHIEKTYTGLSQAFTRKNYHKVGKIKFDDNQKPLKVQTQNGFKFVTEVDVDLLNLQDIKTSSFENISVDSIASTGIVKHDLLIRTSEYGIMRGTNAATGNPIVAIALNNAQTGEQCFIKEQGFITDTSWRWDEEPNTKLFCDSNGRLTVTPDWAANSVQEVGYIVDVDTIYFDPKEKISINSLTVTN